MTDERAQLLARLSSAPDRAADAARAAEAARLTGRSSPPPGEWSAREVVLHLAAVESEVFRARLEQLAADSHPEWGWVEPGPAEGPGAETLDGAIALFAARRHATLEHVADLDEPGWGRSGTHSTYGVLDVAGLLGIAADHDDDHIGGLANQAG